MGYIGAGPTRFNTADELTVTGDAEFNGNLTVKGTTTTIDSVTVQNFDMGDNDRIRIGDSQDLQIYHDGFHSYIQDVGTGNLRIKAENLQVLGNADSEAQIETYQNDGVYLYFNGSPKLATTATGVAVTGNATFGDNDKAIFGAGSDLQIYHTGLKSVVSDQGTGNLQLQGNDLQLVNATDTATYLYAVNGSFTKLYHNNSEKLATTATGVNVTGTVTAENLQTTSAGRIFSGNGGNASNPMIANGSDQDTGIHFPAADTMALGTGGTNRLYLNSSGYVGVSNAVPEAALDVRGHTRLGNRITSATDYTTELSGFGVVSGANRYGSYGMLGFYASSGYTGGARTFAITNAYAANKFAILYGNNSTTVPSIGTGGSVVDGNLALAIDGSGNVGIGTSPNQKLSVAGTIESTSTSTAFYATGVGNYNQQNGSGGTAWAYGSGGGTAAPGTASTTFGMHHWNGNSWKNTLNIDTSGRVTMPYQPSFLAGGMSTKLTSDAVVPFNSTSGFGGHNTGNHFNTSTGQYTCPVAGQYFFAFNLLSDDARTNYHYARLRLNGNTVKFTQEYKTTTVTTGATISTSMVVNCAANDVIDVFAYGAAINIHASNQYTWFSGYLLG